MGGGDGKCLRVAVGLGEGGMMGVLQIVWGGGFQFCDSSKSHLGHLDELCGIWIMFQWS